jgi:hypothetical protein
MRPEVRMARSLETLERYRGGRLSCVEAAELLGISERHFRRLRDRYEVEGAEGLIDRRRGRASGRRAPVERRAEAGDCGGVRAWCGGAGRSASGQRDAESDLPLAPGSASGGERLRSGARGAGWRWRLRTGCARQSRSSSRRTPECESRFRFRPPWRLPSLRRSRGDDLGSERGFGCGWRLAEPTCARA